MLLRGALIVNNRGVKQYYTFIERAPVKFALRTERIFLLFREHHEKINSRQHVARAVTSMRRWRVQPESRAEHALGRVQGVVAPLL
jgi:hypothetical protein